MVQPVLRSIVATFMLAPLGCFVAGDGNDEVAETETGAESSTSMDTSTSDTTTGEPTCVDAIDLLFVIDNSGTMGSSQRRLVESIGVLVEQLDQAGMDWRIGVTTTDNGNPWCPAGTTTPEGGKLVASSCRSRLGDFLFSDTVDVQDEACNDLCGSDSIDLGGKPWIESIDGVANTPDVAEALACILPQGVNGCGFEAPLESMALALARAQDQNESNYGFIREDARLAVVFVSDEADCSYDKDWADIFAQDGNKVFWSDPTASFPTSAVCWNAGVECTGAGPQFDECMPVDKDVNGLTTGDPDAAVLLPVARYTAMLDALHANKQALNPGAEVLVFGIVGVGLDGQIVYQDVGASDPAFQDSFGIGPGCLGPAGSTAVPPVRMRNVITKFDGSMHSICADQYGDAFTAIADRVAVECP